MDATSIQLGKQTRNELREYKDKIEARNYDEAVKALLREVDDD